MRDDSDLGSMIAAVRELFEMTPADDLSHPEYHSEQRRFQDGDGATVELERMRDAGRLLKLIPEIDQNSVQIGMTDGLLDIRFRLLAGTEGRVRI
jgi:hypothetical protein